MHCDDCLPLHCLYDCHYVYDYLDCLNYCVIATVTITAIAMMTVSTIAIAMMTMSTIAIVM